MAVDETKSVKPPEGGGGSTGSSSSRGGGGGTSRDEKTTTIRTGSDTSGRNNNNNNKSSPVIPVPYPSHHPHAMYFPPYPPHYDHARIAASSSTGTTSSNSEHGVHPRSLPTTGPYTSAQFERSKLPQPSTIPSHYGGKTSHSGKTGFPTTASGPTSGGTGIMVPPSSVIGKRKNNNNSQSGKPVSSSPRSLSSQSNPVRDPPPSMTHHFHISGTGLVPGTPAHHHYPPYPPPPPSREDHAHHHRAWAEYHSHYYDPATGAPYPHPPYIPPPPPPLGPPPPDSGATSTSGPYRFSDNTLRRDALSQLKGTSPRSQPFGKSTEHVDSPLTDLNREGATSPSQIESSHREEVTTMGCTCKKTKCLKLYCQCFAVKIYCGANCRCTVCQNTEDFEKERQAAIRSILSRNPQAFDTKFKKSTPDKTAVELSHKLGCKCRKSSCMKKYCECYAAGIRCTENCRCVDCKNTGRGGPPGGEPGEAIAIEAGPLAPTLFAAIAAHSAEEPLRKREPYMMDAAHNLAFLKHSSPVPNKTVSSRTPPQDGEASLPSLTSSEPSWNDSQPDEIQVSTAQKQRSVSEAPNTDERTAVSALLMAAFVVSNETQETLSSETPPHSIEEAMVSTPPDTRATFTTNEEDYETPQKNLLKQFQSPKRKQSETEHRMDHGPMRSGNGTSSTESSPGVQADENENDDSPKRELLEMVVSPIVEQKIKRSRIGSILKGPNRNLAAEMRLGGEANTATMAMETPKQTKTAATNALTPVSARCIDFKRMHVKGTPDGKSQ